MTKSRVPYILAVCVPVFFLYAVCAFGLPALRHDWAWPLDRGLFLADAWQAISGWQTTGLGNVQPRPTNFLFSIALMPIGGLLGGYGAFVLSFALISLVAFYAAKTISLQVRNAWLCAPLCMFVLLNPWIYTEIVAGHIYAVYAYIGCFALISEFYFGLRRAIPLAMSTILICQQLQFAVLILPLLAYFLITYRERIPIITWVFLTLPTIVGIALDRQILATPITLSWQNSLSLKPLDAAALVGYFAGYTVPFESVAKYSMLAVVAVAVVGAMHTWSSRTVRMAVFAAIGLVILASGTKGILALEFQWATVHFVPLSAFRDLYNLLAIVAVIYAVLAAVGCTNRIALRTFTVAGLVTSSLWVAYPPHVFWTSASSLPPVLVDASENTRFLLLPAFQPMNFRGTGSGADPNAFDHPGNVTPLNEYLPEYPANAAVGRYLLSGDTQALSALSVSEVISRPFYKSDVRALQQQSALALPNRIGSQSEYFIKRFSAQPELSVLPLPLVGSLLTNVGGGNVLFSDLEPDLLTPIRPSGEFVDASKGWVDARLAFLARPEFAQTFGGAVTSNKYATLEVVPKIPALINISGKLLDQNGRLISRSSHGYKWRSLGPLTVRVQCRGICLVATQTKIMPQLPLNPRAAQSHMVPLYRVTPWLVHTLIGQGPRRLLRYNTRYDPNWAAFAASGFLPHIRIDGAVNGWLLPNAREVTAVYMVHVTSAIQFAFELLALSWVSLLVGLALSRRIAHHWKGRTQDQSV